MTKKFNWVKRGSTFYNFGHEVWSSCLASYPNDVPEPESEKQKPTIVDVKINLAIRSDRFKSELNCYVPKYGGQMIDKFYTYWSEPNRSYTKMKYEMQKTWDLKRRLHTWSMNNFGGSSFTKNEPPKMKEL